MKTRQNKKGFTLVELVIVIAVIAILAAVLIPTFVTVIGNANNSAAEQEASNVRTEILQLYQGNFDEYCKDYAEAAKSTTITADSKLIISGMDGFEEGKGGNNETFGDFANIKGDITIKADTTSKYAIYYKTDNDIQIKITATEITHDAPTP